MKTILFVNFTDQPFSGIPYTVKNAQGEEETIVDENCKWDNVPDSFPAHGSRYMEDWRAAHFAKHLIIRELNKLGKSIDDVKLTKEMLEKCLIEKGATDVPSQNIEMELMNLKAPATGPSSHIEQKTEVKKKGRPKKEVPAAEAEKEFADLEKVNG